MHFDADSLAKLRVLAQRMLAVMREHKGVGLAAPQVGVNVRMFVMNPTGQPEDDRVYLNPELDEAAGEEERGEGCLSLPEINSPVWRSLTLRLRARDLEGREVLERAEGFIPRIWQHEIDHLDGVLILDKMPVTVKIAHRRQIRELEEEYRKTHPEPVPEPRKRHSSRRRG